MKKYKSVVGKFNGEKFKEDGEYVYPTEEYKNYRELVKLEYQLEKASIPNYIIEYEIENDYIGEKSKSNVKKLKKYVEDFEETFSDCVLYVWGEMGTQKTTALHWVGKELSKKDVKVRFTTMKNLVDLLVNESFVEGSVEKIQELRNCDCLIIDRAFDSDQVTMYKSGYQLPYLDSFLRNRIENDMKATVIISNNHYNRISENKFNADIEDLIRRKVEPYKLVLEFKDHYSQVNDFNPQDLWA